jgi:hypothetical protein
MKKLLLLAIVLFIASPAYAQVNLGTSTSATNPQRSGDATTGLFSSASGAVSTSSAGTEMMRVNGTGVGIGTTSPQALLDVNGVFRVMGAGTPASGAGIEEFYSGGVGYIFPYDRTGGTGKDLILGASGGGMDIKSTGSIGIGTTSPAYTLDVQGTAGSTLSSNSHPVINKINVQAFTSSGTYTPSTGMVYALVEVTGGGGGGSGAVASGAGQGSGGGGGGGGAYARGIKTASTIGSSQTVTVGAGGAAGSSSCCSQNGGGGGSTSLGSLISAGGGSGGTVSSAACGSSCVTGTGGSGGSAGGTYDYGIPGQVGAFGTNINGSHASLSGSGGASGAGSPGGAAAAAVAGTPTAGGSASGYGGGGGGGSSLVSNGAGGGAGAQGAVIITEFVSD